MYYTLIFDEMVLRRCYEVNPSTKTVSPPVDNAFVAMVQTLCGKHVVYYNYDESPTIELLEGIFDMMGKVGMIPVATACDQGGKNFAVWNEMVITYLNAVYLTRKGHRLHVFTNATHLVKNLRNHLIDKGYVVNGELVTAEPMRKLLAVQNTDVKIAKKLTKAHFPVKSLKRQKVSLATQMF